MEVKMIERYTNGILIEVDDLKEEPMQYRYFVYYGVYEKYGGTTEDGTAEIFRNAPVTSFDDVVEMGKSLPSSVGKSIMIKSCQLLAVKVNVTWRPA